MQNNLKNQTSPYLLQHAENPVNWYPWCDEAFEKAKLEEKPIFLSIGYSTCHWCHVMAHESFEDEDIAELLNKDYIAIKVDKEERPDIDSIYMSVCQALTGSGGWPLTIIMTPDQKPFFAGTYFPKFSRHGYMGLVDILETVTQKWDKNKKELKESAEELISYIKSDNDESGEIDNVLIDRALSVFKKIFDKRYGGFGSAPKFPVPHNLLFLMQQYMKQNDEEALQAAEKTLIQMYKGGIFDHIGGGFSRYSTDSYFLVPHFEKMLYDNSLLIMAYCKAYDITKKYIYLDVAKRIATYLIGEILSPEGGFYCAQDADSEGVEGKFYLFDEDEISKILGEKANDFKRHFDITKNGNFEGKNIPNLLKTQDIGESFEDELKSLYEYRKKRYKLHLDDKILVSWNSLAIVAMCWLYRVSGEEEYLDLSKKTQEFIDNNLCFDGRLKISYRKGEWSGEGILDDYAYQIFALVELYEATGNIKYLHRAKKFCQLVVEEFFDCHKGGFYLYGENNEQLITRPKETYDGALFSGNSAMTYNLTKLWQLTDEEKYLQILEKQLAFMCEKSKHYPTGYTMFLMALSDYYEMPEKITVVGPKESTIKEIILKSSLSTLFLYKEKATEEFPLKDNKTTLYICRNHSCMPPITADEY